jgi:hypothetical protein
MIGGWVLALLAAPAAVGCTGSDNHGPDGRILLFDGFSVSTISLDGGRTIRLHLKPEPWGTVAYSPSRKRIAYAAEDGIYVADADGSDARRIPGQPRGQESLNANPSWSPDGDRIVFEHDESLYTMSPDGGHLEFLGGGSTPRWAPDGRIVFTSGYDRNRVYADIVVMGADGGGRKVLARGDYADVSPDGRTPAYSGPGGMRPAANNRAVYVMPLDGGERRRVTERRIRADLVARRRLSRLHAHHRVRPCRLQRSHLRHAGRRRRGPHREPVDRRPGWCVRVDQVGGVLLDILTRVGPETVERLAYAWHGPPRAPASEAGEPPDVPEPLRRFHDVADRWPNLIVQNSLVRPRDALANESSSTSRTRGPAPG